MNTGTGTGPAQRAWPVGRGGTFKPLRDTSEALPRLGEILNVPAETLANTVSLALAAGYGIMLSSTSDQGAVSMIVYAGESRYRSYASSREEFEALLKAVQDMAEAEMAGGTVRPPQARVRPT